MPKIYTIAQVLATPEGQYVSAEVFAVLSNIQPPRGKGPWTAVLTDSTGTITGKFWGGDISYWNGKRMKLSGKGMQRKEYKGVPELSVGDKVDLSFAGAPGTGAQEEETMPGDPLPQPPRYNPAPLPPQPARPPSPTASGTPASPIHGATVHPATVGMCFKIAADFLLKEGEWNGDTPDRIEAMALKLIERAQRLERGESSDVPF